MNRTSVILMIIAAVLSVVLGTMVYNSFIKEKTPSEIFHKEASGVVLVLNEYYYTATLPNGRVIYFSGMDENGDMKDFTFEYDELKKTQSYGTAFFIDDNGTMMTNRHIVDPYINKANVETCVTTFIDGATIFVENAKMEIENEYVQIQRRIENNTRWVWDSFLMEYRKYEDPENYYLQQRQRQLEKDYSDAENTLRELKRINVNRINIESHCEVSIAYNNTYVTSPSDFKQCVVKRVSKDEDVDLALICLKDKRTPQGAYIFHTPKSENNLFGPKKTDREKLQLNQQLILIGYNHGVQLAATTEGIKAQLTTGNVTQEPDDERVMYSIPLLQGSSGSPVVNAYGELVAVNFAGVLNSQSFNFGVPLNRINEFLKQGDYAH